MKSNLTMSCQLTLYVDCRRGIRLSSHGVRYRTLNNSPRTIVFLYEKIIHYDGQVTALIILSQARLCHESVEV